MSQRLPDYEAMRAAQARSQQADRISHDEELECPGAGLAPGFDFPCCSEPKS